MKSFPIAIKNFNENPRKAKPNCELGSGLVSCNLNTDYKCSSQTNKFYPLYYWWFTFSWTALHKKNHGITTECSECRPAVMNWVAIAFVVQIVFLHAYMLHGLHH